MTATVNVTKRLDAPADKAWAAIARIDGLDCWFPIISACRVEGAGVGALRVMTLSSGGEMRDRITDIDADRRWLRYERISHPFPVSDYRGAVQIDDDGDARSVLAWTVRFEVAPEHRDDMLRLIETAISDGVDGLNKELRETRSGSG